jgi:alpha-N-arabinofuranosidase
MNIRTFFFSSTIVCLWNVLGIAQTASTVPVLQIDASRVTAHVSPIHAGLMTEEINHSYDGGLYAELIRNRTFWVKPAAALPFWSLVKDGKGVAGMVLDATGSLNAAVPASLRLDALTASPGNRVGVANAGFWGIPVRPATRYRASFYGKADGKFTGQLTVSIESADGAMTYARANVTLAAGPWRKYEAVLTTAADVSPTAKARLVIATEHPGIFWLTLVSLFPPTWRDRPNGNRIDLMQKLADLQPKFLRFPGGNYLEGETIASRFDWKKTIGDLSDRPGHPAPWGYWSSDGMGYLEFLEWCEDLGTEPVLGVYAGLSFQEPVVEAGPDLQPFVQDALDEIEYTVGGPETTWGARRARDGHPAPFKLMYIEIGNEDGGPTYNDRFIQFYDAIKARYSNLQIIATSPVKGRVPDVLDEHFYTSAKEFFKDVGHYDSYDRKGPKIFVGEWATMEGSPTPNLSAALGDAAWMTGMERNSDLVIMQAYAPLLANVNPEAYQWKTNLIGYDALMSFGSPSYYAQKIFNSNRGDVVLSTSPSVVPGLFYSATRDSRTGIAYLKAVNASGKALKVRVEIVGVSSVQPDGRVIVLSSARPEDTNSLQDPEKIIPVESALTGAGANFEYIFPPYSISVLQLQTR